MKVQRVTKGKNTVWQVDIPASNLGKRRRLFGANREEVVRRASALIHEQGALDSFGPLKPEVHAIAVRWSVGPATADGEPAPGRLTAEEIDAACREYYAQKSRRISVAQAITEYLAAPQETPLAPSHVQSRKVRLNQFEEDFGSRRLASLTAGELGDYCRARGRSAPNFFSNIRALFRYGHLREWIAVNPFDRMAPPSLEPVDKLLITPEQMRAMLRIAAGVDPRPQRDSSGGSYPSLLRLLVLGGFCGLRHSECIRQRAENVDRQTWEIHVTKMKTQRKGMRERYAQTEANAQAWLLALDLPPAGPVIMLGDLNLCHLRRAVCGAVGMPSWPGNALRRSFASYHLAAFENAARTAEICGHTDAQTTKSKYRVPRKKEIALAWFALTPESVLG